MPNIKKKCPEIKKLPSYIANANTSFWKNFPSFFPKKNISSKIKVNLLKKSIQKHWFQWNIHQRKTAKILLATLRKGAYTDLTHDLKELSCKNAKSSYTNGETLTDSIGHWVKTKVVAGPYKKKPFKNFRSNPLMAVVQKSKVRPILNLSAPKINSFNDAVDEFKIKKLEMSSAKLFGQTIFEAGKNATLTKSDICDAYKIIPGHPKQWYCFGFTWLGRYFYDITTVFGSKSAPANFDCLPETLVNIVCTEEKIPKKWVHRQLDDVPVVSPSNTDFAKQFSVKYASLCKTLNIPLAEPCPNKEKAFGPSTKGTVLGINFNTENLTWSISKEKFESIVKIIDAFLNSKTCSLKMVQQLHGKLNDFSQMCDFMLGFRFHIVKLLANFENHESEKRIISENLKKDLWIWKKCIKSSEKGLPIPNPPIGPPVTATCFISDAAGASLKWEGKICKNLSIPNDRGVASIGFKGNKIFFAGGIKWPFHLITKMKDSKNRLFGGKSTTLECIGLLIPLICEPKNIKNKFVIFFIDDINVIYAWEKKYCKNDQETSIIIRTLHILEAFLECKIFIQHTKRMSNEMATLADHLSRQSTTSSDDLEKIKHTNWKKPSGALIDWLKNPVADWSLPNKILHDVKNKL